jgi:hypothetical protein
MNLNFRKLKNSLLSLGLSATLFCTAGLAGVPASANDPNPEATSAYQRKVVTMQYRSTAEGGEFANLSDWLHQVTDMSTEAREQGAEVGIYWQVRDQVLCLNSQILAGDLGIKVNTLNKRLKGTCGPAQPLTVAQVKEMGYAKPRSWCKRAFWPKRTTRMVEPPTAAWIPGPGASLGHLATAIAAAAPAQPLAPPVCISPQIEDHDTDGLNDWDPDFGWT